MGILHGMPLISGSENFKLDKFMIPGIQDGNESNLADSTIQCRKRKIAVYNLSLLIYDQEDKKKIEIT